MGVKHWRLAKQAGQTVEKKLVNTVGRNWSKPSEKTGQNRREKLVKTAGAQAAKLASSRSRTGQVGLTGPDWSNRLVKSTGQSRVQPGRSNRNDPGPVKPRPNGAQGGPGTSMHPPAQTGRAAVASGARLGTGLFECWPDRTTMLQSSVQTWIGSILVWHSRVTTYQVLSGCSWLTSCTCIMSGLVHSMAAMSSRVMQAKLVCDSFCLLIDILCVRPSVSCPINWVLASGHC